MTTAITRQASTGGLPPSLRTAQEAIQLPDVREMLRRLSEYQLGVFMPHMHDDRTGAFNPLPDDVVQVESGLETTFRPTESIASQTGRFLPVGWVWRAGASAPSAVCEMVSEESADEAGRTVKHNMRKGGPRVRQRRKA
jgi:hypothetical protein